jgi:hypothetical protein
LPPGVNFEIFSAILFTSKLPFPSNLSLAFCFLSLAPPTTFALPVEAVPPFVYSFFNAPTPFSYLKIVIMSIVAVFPSLKPKPENNDP